MHRRISNLLFPAILALLPVCQTTGMVFRPSLDAPIPAAYAAPVDSADVCCDSVVNGSEVSDYGICVWDSCANDQVNGIDPLGLRFKTADETKIPQKTIDAAIDDIPHHDIATQDLFWHAFGLCGPVPTEKRFLINSSKERVEQISGRLSLALCPFVTLPGVFGRFKVAKGRLVGHSFSLMGGPAVGSGCGGASRMALYGKRRLCLSVFSLPLLGRQAHSLEAPMTDDVNALSPVTCQ